MQVVILLRSIRIAFLPVLAGLFLAGPAPAGATKPATNSVDRPFEVKVVADIDYHNGEEADPIKHKLDLYLPRDHQDFPVLFFVHGGAWRSGDKNYFGVYSTLGRFYARHGIGTVVINYRLSPKVQHPEHIRDVARAFAWTVNNISKYGGRTDAIFLCGHSAGGHLVALLAADESYLRGVGLETEVIRGVIPISGVYRIPTGVLQSVFGKDPENSRKAGPIEHAREGLPPFLILYAEHDYPVCGRGPSEDFCRALKDRGCQVSTQEFEGNNHLSIVLNAARSGAPVSDAILNFIAEQMKGP